MQIDVCDRDPREGFVTIHFHSRCEEHIIPFIAVSKNKVESLYSGQAL